MIKTPEVPVLYIHGGLCITRVANQGLCLHEISIGLLEETVTRHLEGVSSPVDLGQHYKLPPCQPGPPPCSRPPIRASTSLPWLLHNLLADLICPPLPDVLGLTLPLSFQPWLSSCFAVGTLDKFPSHSSLASTSIAHKADFPTVLGQASWIGIRHQAEPPGQNQGKVANLHSQRGLPGGPGTTLGLDRAAVPSFSPQT